MVKDRQRAGDELQARYEYRVWGRHRKARKILAKLATTSTDERVEDCYFLVDDATWNAKVRNNKLKIKQLVAHDKGFERWTADRPESAEAAPSPFDDLYAKLRLDRPRRGKNYDLEKAVSDLDPDRDERAVFVVKHRRRYTVGRLRAEVSDIKINETSQVLRTLAIEGDDLDELVALRKKLGLRNEPNIAVHEAIGPAIEAGIDAA